LGKIVLTHKSISY